VLATIASSISILGVRCSGGKAISKSPYSAGDFAAGFGKHVDISGSR
jgi:hypothetical protein